MEEGYPTRIPRAGDATEREEKRNPRIPLPTAEKAGPTSKLGSDRREK